MDKQTYLKQLETLLQALPAAERAQVSTFYAESIDDRMEAGLSEEEAVASMETPGAVAERIIEEMPPVPRALAQTRRKGAWFFWLLIILGSPLWLCLLFAALCVLGAAYLCMWVLVLCAWIMAGSCLLGLVLGVVALAMGLGAGHIPGALMQLGIGLVLGGLGLAAVRIAAWVTAWVGRGHMALTRWVKGFFVRRDAEGRTDVNAPSVRRVTQAGQDSAEKWRVRLHVGRLTNFIFLTSGIIVALGVVLGLTGFGLVGFDEKAAERELYAVQEPFASAVAPHDIYVLGRSPSDYAE